MQCELLKEPEVELGGGHRHVDPRFGILHFGPLDAGTRRMRREIRLGIVGSRETAEKFRLWVEHCSGGVEAKESRQPNLFPRFPGFTNESPFEASIVTDDRLVRCVPGSELARLVSLAATPSVVEDTVALFIDELKFITEQGGVDVVVCAPPAELLRALETGRSREDPSEKGLDEASDETTDPAGYRPAFHDILKARGMKYSVPIQMIRQETYDKSVRRQAKRGGRPRVMQDEATRAWNFFTALYYKSGGSLWRLARETVDLATCYIGVSFFKTTDNERVLAAVAQVFNERGEGMIVRGGEARLDKEDRQPHLSAVDASKLLRDALRAYRAEHRTSPARLVLHKTSSFSGDERDGFEQAGSDERLSIVDLVAVRRSWMRLFREGTYPPLRGTWVGVDDQIGLIYLRGSVDFFATYPGMYVPRPLEYVRACGETTLRELAREMLCLSKLNWNNTQFDGGEPITVRAARRVGDILKNIPEGAPCQARFGFFM
jgi:hypothetical protein